MLPSEIISSLMKPLVLPTKKKPELIPTFSTLVPEKMTKIVVILKNAHSKSTSKPFSYVTPVNHTQELTPNLTTWNQVTLLIVHFISVIQLSRNSYGQKEFGLREELWKKQTSSALDIMNQHILPENISDSQYFSFGKIRKLIFMSTLKSKPMVNVTPDVKNVSSVKKNV
jgi:hypothetical protein